jgi:hypothetical protein|tara:strand:- start:2801 stop:3040 length:240 start_codon:yes stop_codon:yes gene_type:complete
MIEYIFLGAYGTYWFAFCSMFGYTLFMENREEKIRVGREYIALSNRVPSVEIRTTSETLYANRNVRLDTILEVDESNFQ